MSNEGVEAADMEVFGMNDVKAQIAQEALAIVNGARRQAYGTPEQNFGRISTLQNAYMASRLDPAGELTALDVAMMALMTKVARIAESPTHRDSYVDLVGYSLCAAEVAGLETPRRMYKAGEVIEVDPVTMKPLDASRLIEPEVAAAVAPREFKVGDKVNVRGCENDGRPGIIVGGSVRGFSVQWQGRGAGSQRHLLPEELVHVG